MIRYCVCVLFMFIIYSSVQGQSKSYKYKITGVDFLIRDGLSWLVLYPEDSDYYVEYDDNTLSIKIEGEEIELFNIIRIEQDILDIDNFKSIVFSCENSTGQECCFELTIYLDAKLISLYQNYNKEGDCAQYIYSLKEYEK